MMEIDSPTPVKSADTRSESKNEQEKTLKVHPLVIINISDHHTRVTTGGSHLDTNSAIIGLLFGYQDGLVIHIIDAIEITTFGDKQSIQTKIELHQKVFPQHEAVGWYRVSPPSSGTGGGGASATPTAEDLHLTHTAVRDYNESPLFFLMTTIRPSDGGATVAAKTPAANNEVAVEDNQLPISIYETIVSVDEGSSGGGAESSSSSSPRAVFCQLEFELDSREPERIAVEKVFNTQPRIFSKTTTDNKNDAAGGGVGGGRRGGGATATTTTTVVHETESGLDLQLNSVTSSITSLNARIDCLLGYLRKVKAGEVEPDYRLLRMIDQVIQRIPPNQMDSWEQEFEKEERDMLMYSYLAVVTKTAKAVQGYNDKFRVVHDGNKREMRGRY